MARTASRFSRSRAPWWTERSAWPPPKNWQSANDATLKTKGKNAVCIRTGYAEGAVCALVVLDADGEDAIAVVERLLAEMCAGIRVPHVQTQRGAGGRHYYFRSTESGLAANLKSGAKLVIGGVTTNVDVRAGHNGEGIGCILAPPTAVVGGVGEVRAATGTRDPRGALDAGRARGIVGRAPWTQTKSKSAFRSHRPRRCPWRRVHRTREAQTGCVARRHHAGGRRDGRDTDPRGA